MKREFLKVLNDKYWGSLTMLHFVASFLDPSLRHFRFVKKLNDRDGFFKQIRESLATLASEVSLSTAQCPAEPVKEESDDIQETDHKKRKASPFDWFQNVPRNSTSTVSCSRGIQKQIVEMMFLLFIDL